MIGRVKPKNNVELQRMREAGRLAADVLDYITPFVVPGVSTQKLNDLCHAFTVERGAKSAPLNYRGFPRSICTSVNDVVCHGIPSDKEILKEGDIVNLDVTVLLNGFHGDTSRMFFVGEVSPERAKLVRVTYDAMMKGIATIKSGSCVSDIGKAIEAFIAPHGYGIVKDYCGHGLGRVFHEDPMVVHYAADDSHYKLMLRKGMTFTVEPMINTGGWETAEVEKDGWTVRTKDGSDSAQFEHSLAVTDHGVEILTKSPKGFDCPPYKL